MYILYSLISLLCRILQYYYCCRTRISCRLSTHINMFFFSLFSSVHFTKSVCRNKRRKSNIVQPYNIPILSPCSLPTNSNRIQSTQRTIESTDPEKKKPAQQLRSKQQTNNNNNKTKNFFLFFTLHTFFARLFNIDDPDDRDSKAATKRKKKRKSEYV